MAAPVITSSPVTMRTRIPARCGVVDGLHRRFAGRIDHGDDGRHLEIGDVAQQVAVGVERGGIEIAERRGHHALPLALHAGDRVVGLLLAGSRPTARWRPRRGQWRRGRSRREPPP